MKKVAIKIVLDIVMTVLFIALMNTAITGLNLHEIIGLGLCGGFLAHKLLNLDWIKRMIRKLRDKSAGNKLKVMLFVDALLLAGMTLIVVSGIFISEVVFIQFNLLSTLPWKEIHLISSYGTLILIAVHLGLHWKMIMKAFGRMFHIQKESQPRKILLRIAALAIVALGIKATVDTSFFGSFAVAQSQSGTILQSGEPVVSIGTGSGSDDDTSSSDSLGLSTISAVETADTPTLNEFLSNMVCTACGHRCSLLSPRCGKGQQQAQQAEQEYAAAYSTAEEESGEDENSSAADSSSGESTTDSSSAAREENTQESASPSAASSTDEQAGSTEESVIEESITPDVSNGTGGAQGGNFSIYLEYLAILGMLTTASHYLTVLGERNNSNTNNPKTMPENKQKERDSF